MSDIFKCGSCGDLVAGLEPGDICQFCVRKLQPDLAAARSTLAVYDEKMPRLLTQLAAAREELATAVRLNRFQADQTRVHLAALRAFADEVLDNYADDIDLTECAAQHGLLKDGKRTARLCPEMAKPPC